MQQSVILYISTFFIPVVSNIDTEVEMRLYDKNGNISYATKHNTLSGNSYMFNPKTKVTVHDGVAGAFRKMAKETGWKSGKKHPLILPVINSIDDCLGDLTGVF